MIDYNTMNGLEVLVHLLTSKDGIFLWAIMGFGLAVFLSATPKPIQGCRKNQPADIVNQPNNKVLMIIGRSNQFEEIVYMKNSP